MTRPTPGQGDAMQHCATASCSAGCEMSQIFRASRGANFTFAFHHKLCDKTPISTSLIALNSARPLLLRRRQRDNDRDDGAD